MARLLRLLLATLLASTLLGSALAEGEAPAAAPPPAFSVLANSTLTCSARLPTAVVGCFLERPVLVLGALELAVGVDAQAALRAGLEDAHLAPYLIAAVYQEALSAWLEVRLPELAGLHPIGDPDYLRVGFSIRFQ